VIVDIFYTRKRWQIENQTGAVRQVKDLAKNNIINGMPYFTTGQEKLLNDLRVNYYLNPKTLMHFSLGFIYQKEVLTGNQSDLNYVYFAFRTALRNVNF
jgi:hypothetical protein